MSQSRPTSKGRRTAPRAEHVRVTTLPSGLRVVTEHMPQLSTAALGVWVGAGTRHELPGEQGLAHLLEHMAFKGTRRRSALAIVEEIEAVGGDLNAETSVERTAYYARVLGENVPLALDILSDILTEPAFDKDELKREKGVVLQEIGACEDTPDDVVFDMFMETAYGGAPIGRRILGTPKTVRAQTAESMRSFLDRQYRAPDMVVGAAGAVDHDQVVEEVNRRFGAFASEPPAPPTAGAWTGGDERSVRKLEQAHLVVGFEGRSFLDQDHYALHVFSNLLGGGMSSRLFQEIREKRGLCYEVYSFHQPFSDTGFFAIYGGTGEKLLPEFVPVMLDCVRAAAEAPSEAEVARAKAQIKVSLLMGLESCARRAEQMARHVLSYGRVIPREEIVAAIDAITPADVSRVARAMLATAPTVAAVGPVRGLPDVAGMARRIGAPTPGASPAKSAAE
ncbi:insulinase family protein [Alsobacter sp. SYSU M60028]|uniref:Insulinase family protein n=1 Tax=Alsobacter ponti TaxID=2962936 RepID=A0ABT1LCK9_9HYPH|nr:pitrilysin family protein [Alsobacter ponti]MCP8939235.1 insulinase family protein [Alsobacter ponti]